MATNGTVFLIDDDDSVREALTSIITEHEISIYSYSSGVQFFEEFKSLSSPQVIVVDMKMPLMTGLELQSKLAEMQVQIPTIFISGHSHKDEIIQSLKEGACDFLLKPFKFEELLKVINKCLSLDARYKEIKNKFDLLTPREKEVFNELVSGNQLKTIAIKWDVSESVIKLHKSNVMQKLQIDTLQELTKISLILDSPKLLREYQGSHNGI